MAEPIAKVDLLIRRPAADVFDAFVDPARLCVFWLDHASAPLAAGARVDWHFKVPGATARTEVTTFQPPHRLEFAWSDGVEVSMRFEPEGVDRQATVLTLEARGFGDGANAVAVAVEATEGFTLVVGDLKAWLETGRVVGLVQDKAELIVARSQR